jgi:predicted amidohydrolase YtcJ
MGLGLRIKIFVIGPFGSKIMLSTKLLAEKTRYSDLIVVTSSRIVLNETQDASPATLEISPLSGKFVAIHPGMATANEYPSTVQFLDYGDLVVMPGLVDPHVHINEP